MVSSIPPPPPPPPLILFSVALRRDPLHFRSPLLLYFPVSSTRQRLVNRTCISARRNFQVCIGRRVSNDITCTTDENSFCWERCTSANSMLSSFLRISFCSFCHFPFILIFFILLYPLSFFLSFSPYFFGYISWNNSHFRQIWYLIDRASLVYIIKKTIN